jgi:hypothetical protein
MPFICVPPRFSASSILCQVAKGVNEEVLLGTGLDTIPQSEWDRLRVYLHDRRKRRCSGKVAFCARTRMDGIFVADQKPLSVVASSLESANPGMPDFGPRGASLVERLQQFQQRPAQPSPIPFRTPPPTSLLQANTDHVCDGGRPFRLTARIPVTCDRNMPFRDAS